MTHEHEFTCVQVLKEYDGRYSAWAWVCACGEQGYEVPIPEPA